MACVTLQPFPWMRTQPPVIHLWLRFVLINAIDYIQILTFMSLAGPQFSFSRKTSIHLGQATVKGFNLTREIGVESVALSLSMESGLICAALANGYYIMLNTFLKNSKPIQLCSFDTKDKPQVVHVKKVSVYSYQNFDVLLR